MNKGGILAIIGGVFGILIGLAFMFLGSLANSMFEVDTTIITVYGLVIIGLSVLGIVCGFWTSKKMIAGILLILAGVVILLMTSILGGLTFILFLIAGIMMIMEERKSPATVRT